MNIFEHIDRRVVVGFGAILIVLLGWFFYSLFDNKVEDSSLTTLSVSPLDATLGRELLAALATLKSTELDADFFKDPVFLTLKDFGVKIPSQPVGRRNPFAAFVTAPPSKTPAKPASSAGAGATTPLPVEEDTFIIGGFEVPSTPPSTGAGTPTPANTPAAVEEDFGGFDFDFDFE